MKHILKVCSILLLTGGLATVSSAQIAINADGSTPDSSAIIDINSTDRGMLIPRMSTSEREGINQPADGLLVYDREEGSFWYYESTQWNKIAPSALNFPSVDGDSTQVLATDGNGNLQWVDDTDDQTLFLEEDLLSISNGDTVDLSSVRTLDSAGLSFYLVGSMQLDAVQEEFGTFSSIGTTNFWQSFTPTVSGFLGQIDVRIYQSFSTGNLRLYTGQGTGSSPFFELDIDLHNNWNSIDLQDYDIEVVAGQEYTFHITEDSGSFSMHIKGSNEYKGGRSNYHSINDWPFRTYIAPITTPELVQVQNNGTDFDINLTNIDTLFFVDGTHQTTSLPDPAGALEKVLRTNNSGSIFWDDTVVDTDTDDQTLSLSGSTLSIVDGNSVDLSSIDTDTDTDDQTLSLSGSTLSITDGNAIDLSSIDTDTDEQTLSLSGSTLSIADGNAIDLASIDTDTDKQTIDVLNLNGSILEISLQDDGETTQTLDLSSLEPIGTIQMWPTATPPSGWLICDGATFSSTTYPDLATILGTTNLPNFKGRFPLGVGNSGANGATNHNLSSTGGEETHVLTINEMPAHSHGITYSGKNKSGNGGEVSDLESSSDTENTESTGGSQAHNNMPPFYTINFIIKAD